MHISLSKCVRRAAYALRLRGPLAEDPRARVLHGLVTGLMLFAVTIFLPLIVPLFVVRKLAGTLLLLCFMVIWATTLVLLRRGSLRRASWIFVTAMWSLETVLIVLSGGIRSSTVAHYMVLPILAAWLLEARAVVAVAAVCLASSLAMAILEQSGVPLLRYFPGTPMSSWGVFVFVMVMAAVPVVIVLRILSRALVAVRASEELLRSVIDSSTDFIYVKDREMRTVLCNQSFAKALGKSVANVRGKTDVENGWDSRLVKGDPPKGIQGWEADDRAALSGKVVHAGSEPANVNGEIRFFDSVKTPLRDATGEIIGLVGLSRDITERQRAQEERARLEVQLQRAQKLESIGRLAGGVAHDFNNLLTVINGYSDLILGTLKQQDPQRESLAEIRKAGGRAAELTRQLLAFSRKQLIEPRPVNLNSLIADSRDMLGRLVGEDIDIVIDLDTQPGQVMADPGQLHQVLMNFVVNARDAMPSGGRLTLRSSRMHLDGDAAAPFPGAAAGPYAVMEVSDTGEGMSEEVQQEMFEPFFTTKPAGTGLGLSTVYGIVRQARGWIQVESQPGMGATFRIGLPLLAQPGFQGVTAELPARRLEGSETILVVEDQDEVRRFALAVLKSFQYRTLEARSGGEALRIADDHPGPIHLLLTDVVMPQMTGKQLADRLKPLRPEMNVLYMSGYTADVILRQGVVDSGIGYIEKPFSPEALALKVRSVLEEPRLSPKVLVVDDEASIRGLFAKILTGGGYDVVVTCDATQAPKVLQAGSFDLVITDLVMPNREGIETIQAIKASHPGLKIIAVSGAFGESLLRPAAMLGADATSVKPVGPEQLLETVRKTLAQVREPEHSVLEFGGQTILVVDDQAPIRSLIRQALEPCGAAILEAANGDEALAFTQWHKGPIALAIIDFKMPGLNGLDLAAQFGRDVPDLKILYVSSASESIAMESLLRRSPELVLLKPFTAPELLQRIRSLLLGGEG